jgi:hypothetical protein
LAAAAFSFSLETMNEWMKNLPTRAEWWHAIRWVLLIFTIIVAITMTGSFVEYERVVASGHPWLPRAQCAGCPLCGMTRSFCALSSGRWAEAALWNRGGPVLYAAGWLWLALSALLTARQVFRHTRTRVE